MGDFFGPLEWMVDYTMSGISVEEFKELLKDNQIYHSDFQIDHFITTKAGGTIFGMYCQSLRELDGRYEALKTMIVDIKIAEAEAEELEEWYRQGDSQIPKSHRTEIHRLNALKKRMAIEGMERSLHHKIREFVRFYYQARRLKQEIGELGPTKRARLEKETWLYKLRLHAYIDIVSSNRVSNVVFENILSLDEIDRRELINDIEVPERLIEFFDKNKIELPSYEVGQNQIAAVRRLIDVESRSGDGESPNK